ncbi:MAG: hypothetical protein EX267_07410 [Acidimicrobiia bacterium]|nr:MAG: hypothetical protein EX267_07410 [Acidimicrobiia bacterium]
MEIVANTRRNRSSRRLSRAGTLVVITAALTLSLAAPVAAHDPIFLTDEQATPDTGPYLPDGAISWAIYGTFPADGETRGFEFDLRDGDDLYASLLIPNLEPEISLPDAELPYVELTLPNGEVRTLEAEIREVFDEQFSQTSYVTLVELKEPAVAGRHTVVVQSRGPARFVVAVGEREVFFTPAERTVDRPSDFFGIAGPLNAWYQTPPTAEAADAPNDEVVDDVEIDVQALETELEALAQEGADEEQAAGEADGAPEGGSGLTWVLPVAIVVVAGAGVGMWLARRRASAA